MKLVYASTGLEVKSGDVVHVDGKPFYIMDMREPHKSSSTGRVLCKAMSDKAWINEWYPGVIGAVWIN